jgi:hypothetical protein
MLITEFEDFLAQEAIEMQPVRRLAFLLLTMALFCQRNPSENQDELLLESCCPQSMRLWPS